MPPSRALKWVRRSLVGTAFGTFFMGLAVLYKSRNVSIIDPPRDSALVRAYATEPTFVDCYEYRVPSERLADHFTKEDALVRFARRFYTVAPGWSSRAMALRDAVAARVGLQTSDTHTAYVQGRPVPLGSPEERDALLAHLNMQVGDGIGQFRVLHRDRDQLLLGANDKHLDFRILLSIRDVDHLPDRDHPTAPLQPKWQFLLGSAVRVNHWTGYLYLLPVLPVHMVLSRLMLQRAVDAFAGPYVA